MSPLPPAANGKMIFVSGPDCAHAALVLAPADKARPPATNSRRFIDHPSRPSGGITTDRRVMRNSQFIQNAACEGRAAAAKQLPSAPSKDPVHETPRAQKLSSHRRKSRLVLADRFRRRRGARVVA